MLAELLHFPKLRNIKLESAVIHLFVIFFCHRISDYPSITPSLYALVALVKYHCNSFDMKYYDVLDIFQTIIKVLKVQSLAQTIRQKVFNLFDAIISSDIFKNNESSIQKSKLTYKEDNLENSKKMLNTTRIRSISNNSKNINNDDNNENSHNNGNNIDIINNSNNNDNNNNNNNDNNDNNDSNNNINNINNNDYDIDSVSSYFYIIELFGSEQACYEVFCGVVNSVEGEKDPRCLVVALQILSKFITKFSFLFSLDYNNSSNSKEDREEMIEKIFENVACYFPITFTPPDDDTYGVTTEILINSLENVFCAHSMLHKYVLPFLIDHLTDESSVGRVQATKFLVRIGSSKEYSPSVYRYTSPGDDSEDSEEHSVLASLAER